MSNKSRLQTNNTNLQALIDKANNLPEAGSGGGSVETCTVTLNVADSVGVNRSYRIVCMTYENGEYYDSGGMVFSKQPPTTFYNVPKFSLLTIIRGIGSTIHGVNISNMKNLYDDEHVVVLQVWDDGDTNECYCTVE